MRALTLTAGPDAAENVFCQTIDAYTGLFLPEADSEWAKVEREALQRWIIQLGLETLDAWYVAGEHAKCLSLASRLLALEPFDEGLNEFLLKATLVTQGEGAARQAFKRVRECFEDELGEVPPRLIAFREPLTQTD